MAIAKRERRQRRWKCQPCFIFSQYDENGIAQRERERGVLSSYISDAVVVLTISRSLALSLPVLSDCCLCVLFVYHHAEYSSSTLSTMHPPPPPLTTPKNAIRLHRISNLIPFSNIRRAILVTLNESAESKSKPINQYEM